jgi:DNA polymerase III epsilon subunit-like protein
MEYNYVCIDVETTGLNPQNDEVIEVTAIEFNRLGIKGNSISTLCRPVAGFIPIEVSKINKITYDMVKDKPVYLESVREQIAKFVGNRTLVGHNIDDFDLGFLKITPTSTCDTLKMCRRRYTGGNKLKLACTRLGIKWEENLGHRSGYDVEKTIGLFVKLKDLDDKENKDLEIKLFDSSPEKEQIDKKVDKNLIDIIESQSYSFSRINLFRQCMFKWFMTYIKNVKEPSRDYLICGNICHKIAEWSGEWVYRELFANKFIKYCELKNIIITDLYREKISKEFRVEPFNVDYKFFAYYIYKYNYIINVIFDSIEDMASLIKSINEIIDKDSYERPSTPDYLTYSNIIKKSITFYKCTDSNIIKDVNYIMNKYYEQKSFDLLDNEIILTELKIVLDKNLSILDDFYSNKAFIRGIIDVLSYAYPFIIITDYKTSRKMMTVDQLKNDMQMKMYVLLAYYFLPKESYQSIIFRIEYIRFNKSIEYQIDNVKQVVDEALEWINDAIKDLKLEISKEGNDAFKPIRNEYCHTCYLGEDGICPLFNKQNSETIDINSITNVDTCIKAWKRIECNKAENAKLLKICKLFVNQCDSTILIDEKAILDFYTTNSRSYDPLKTVIALREKDIPLNEIIPYYSITEDSFEKLCNNKNITFTKEEIEYISNEKTVTKFDARIENKNDNIEE